MNERQANLLCGLVEQYIRSAAPVSSQSLAKTLRLSLSPATIRYHLLSLDEAGFLLQPHVSAGRIPTDRGYRFYVDYSASPTLPNRQVNAIGRRYRENLTHRSRSRARVVAQLLSQLSHAVAVTVWTKPVEIQQAGLSELMAELAADGSELPVIGEVAGFLDDLDNFIPTVLTDLAEGEIAIYIGEENPFYPTSSLAVMVSRTVDSHSEPVILMLLGQKRMPYHHHSALLQLVSRLVSLS